MGQTVYPQFCRFVQFLDTFGIVLANGMGRLDPYTHLIDGSRRELCSSSISTGVYNILTGHTQHVLFKQS